MAGHEYVSLKDLATLPKPGTPSTTPPFPGNLKTRHVKRKQPRYKNGVAIYWDEVPLRKELEEEDYENFGCFDFIDKFIIRTFRRFFDKAFGALLGLPKFDETFVASPRINLLRSHDFS
ncbi:Receptor-like protein kinase [Corchorus capsularis]|uniref:Receptor-like protein kinase n=1 Tax=Corchorus capsularis TaxID=210143 RepID=A0A1R3IXQ2_COCAP|nr:Receptor-like protein kinase [Corchorus capsularis]